MKLSWRDTVSTLLVVVGGVVVWAKYLDYSWAILGSWRSATAVLAVIGVLMFAVSTFDFKNYSILNLSEMVLGAVAVGLAMTGMIFTSEPIFYTLAAIIGIVWAVDTARRARHSLMNGGTSLHHPSPAH